MGTGHRVVIVGGGFGGLYAAKILGRAPVEVTLIDRRNFHLFQPLLYQVATGALSPGEIASPRAPVVGANRNTEVLLGEVCDLDVEAAGASSCGMARRHTTDLDRRHRRHASLFRQ